MPRARYPFPLRGPGDETSMSTTTEERKTDDERKDEDENGKKGRRWWKWVLGGVLLVIVIVAAVVLLGGSDKKKAPPSGSLTAGKQQLLPLSPSGKLAGSPGQKVVGRHEIVRSIVRGQGFWVGGSDVDRVFVRYPPAGQNVGPQVRLEGKIKPAPTNVKKAFGLSTKDAAKVTAEGAYIEAVKVAPVGTA
jgi:hypothetical protein